MTTVSYTITRALNELKLLDARIARATQGLNLAAVQIGNKRINGHIEVETFSKDAASGIVSVSDLISRRNKIKSLIVKSNAVEQIKFPSGKVMTVAEAIEHKTSIAYTKNLVQRMRTQYNGALTILERESQIAKQALEKRIADALGKDTKGKENVVEEITKNFNTDNEPKLIDPVGLAKLIETMTAEIEEFENECDFLLSESNTRTTIEVPA